MLSNIWFQYHLLFIIYSLFEEREFSVFWAGLPDIELETRVVLLELGMDDKHNQLKEVCIITNCYLNVCFDMTQPNGSNTCPTWSPALL